MICKEEPLDAGHPPRPLAAPPRGPGLLPRWEEVQSSQQKTNMDFSRKEGTWISYLGRSPSPHSLLASRSRYLTWGSGNIPPSAPSIPPGCRANIWKENILISFPHPPPRF